MKANELLKALSPFALIANKHALSPVYRTLQLSKKIVRGCSSYAIVELMLELPLGALPKGADCVYVDADSFLAVLRSLPDDDVKMSVTEGVMAWECGSAKGRLALATVKDMPEITVNPHRDEAGEFWEPTDAFYQALELGSLSCTNIALTSAGMYGVVIDNRDILGVYSSDNVSVSYALAGEAIDSAPEVMTLTPDAVDLLRACIMYGDDVAALFFTDKEIEIEVGPLRAVIKQVPPLKHDFRELAASFAKDDVTAPIPQDRISAFIKRAAALAESKKSAVVELGGSGGRLTLSFAEGTASSEEYYLVEGEVPDIAPITIDSGRMARALAHVDTVVLDHAARSVLILRNTPAEDDDVIFGYLLSGRQRA